MQDETGASSSEELSGELPKVGVSIAVVRGDRVLMAQRGKPPLAGLWSFPGGHLKAGEALRDGALRELREETGVTAATPELLDVIEVIQPAAHYVVVVFVARWLGGEPLAADDCAAVQWMTVDEAGRTETTPGAGSLVQRAIAVFHD